jgi:hypothetical protein
MKEIQYAYKLKYSSGSFIHHLNISKVVTKQLVFDWAFQLIIYTVAKRVIWMRSELSEELEEISNNYSKDWVNLLIIKSEYVYSEFWVPHACWSIFGLKILGDFCIKILTFIILSSQVPSGKTEVKLHCLVSFGKVIKEWKATCE